MQLFDAATGTPGRKLTGESRMVAGGADGSVGAWDAATGRVVRQFTGHRHAVTSLALTPDGKTLATGSADTTVLLWDMAGW